MNDKRKAISLCVSITHDRFMDRAFTDEPTKSLQTDYYNYRKQRTSDVKEISPQHPLVFRLYGDTQDEESMVLTETDLLDFLAAVIQSTPALPSYLTQRFADPNTSFLFLGFGLYQWHLRILLHVLKAWDHKEPSLALERELSQPQQALAKTEVFFNDHCNLQFSGLSLDQFTTELAERYLKRSAGTFPAQPQLPEDAPKVFLCHCSDDRDKVAELEAQLRTRGIATWFDRQQLRGGDNWNNQIEYVLEKQVNYVVVMQTPQMLDRGESYYYKEIRVALRRDERFADDTRFVIPCHLEPSEPMPRLEHLNYVDLTKAHGLEELIQAILQDWERRGHRHGELTRQ